MAASPLRHGSPRDTEVSVSPAFSQMGSDDLHSELATSVSSALSTVRIRSHKANFDLNIPIDPSASVNYFALESIKADFERHLLAAASAESDAAPAPAEAEAEQSKATSADQALFLASFLRFLAERIAAGNDQGRGFASELSLLWASWNQFHSEFLGPSADIHSFALSLGLERRQQLLRAYFEAYAALEAGHFTPQLRRPRLLEEAKAKTIEIYAVFGGQGNNRGYLDELQELYETYRPLVQPLLVAAEGRLCQLARSVASPDGTPHALYQHGYRLLSWIDGTGQRPPADYLTANPISGPMLFLTQLTQYYATCRSIGMTTAEVRDCFAACSGHSQGIIAATVFASAGGNDEFIRRTVGTLDLLFQLAFHAVSATACDEVEPEMQAEAVEAGHDIPTPMLLVNGLERSFLEPRVAACNAYLDADRQIYFSLVNGPTTVVLTGDPRALMGLIRELAPLCASPKLDQTKVPSAKRKPTFKMRFLPVDLPYHAPYLEGVAPAAIEAAAIRWSPKDLVLPVFSTYDGSDLRSLPDDGLVSNLCDQLLTLPVHWQDAIDLPPSATHIVDFGTGGLFGIGGITARNLQGRGIHTMIVSGTHPASADFYRVDGVPRESRWDNAFQPKLVKTSAGKLLLDTPMSRLLGRPPIMVAGMTPTTVSAKLNAAVLNAGYHIELAGGGLYNEKALRARVAEIQSMTEPGHGLTLNSLYINQRQWAVQLPAWIQMRREGLPLEGFCVAAGIPTPQKAEELLTSLREAGIRHVSFKPGSLAGIQQVCKIAAQNPDMGILLQWTGGRAGGHHSAEDFHQPILASYGLIRRQPNLVLVAGSGFTCDDDVWPYLSGEWSVERGASPMPFDGVLFGSRIMTAREAGTSLGVKQLIAQTPGCTDAEWQGTYDKPTGGILTVNSEMNEPIHQIANRATMLWAELDRECFSLPSKEKQLAYLAKNKTRLIGRLNRDFQKVWFAQNKDGVPQLDVADMTYEEVCVRMLSLLFVRDQARWIDRSHRTLFGDWCRRVEERFALSASGKPVGETRSAGRSYRLQSYTDLDTDPHRCLERLMAFYGHARTTQLTAEDAAFFHALCWRAGQKPPPFITRFGEDFATQFKKDSLWQAEDLDAVVDRDPQRVCILQGPIAVRGQSTVDEPVADVLGSVEAGLIAKVLDRFYGGDVSRVPEVEYLDRALFGKRSEHAGLLPPHEVATLGSTVVKTFKADRARTAPVEAWLASLAGKETGWLRALLCSGSVVRGKNVVANPMASLLRPRAGMTVEVTESTAGEPVRLSAFGAARSYGDHDEGFQTLEVARSASAADEIDVTVFEERLGEAVPLHLRFAYRPDQPWAPLHEVEEGRNDRTKRFFWKMWFDAEMPPASQLSPTATFTSQPKALEPEAIKSFCDVVGARSKAYASGQAPMDFAIAAGWEAIMQAAVASCDADLLSLVHLSNEFRMLGTSAGGAALQAGDVCTAEARVVSIRNSDTGKTVRVAADISRQRNGAAFEPVFRVTSEFFYRGSYADFDRCFELSEDDYAVTISSSADLAILRAKEWLEWTADAEPMQGAKLRFRFRTDAKHRDSTTFRSLDVTGSVLEERAELGGDLVEVARIDYSADAPSVGNPVLDYVRRFGRDATDDAVPLDTAYELGHAKSVRTFYAPASNEAYSRASGDFNPIHVNPYFASLAGLPGTITHGMFTSAATRRFVEAIAADGDPARCTSFTAEFSGMVLPGDRLSATLSHVAMRRGEKVISVRLVNQRDETVLVGEAQVRQPTTVYVFTGQGSQTQGMGMDLYASSDVARAIWDEAEEHLYGSLGISIIEIVRENPKSKTVFFGGASGQRIRSTYMAMDYVTTDSSGNPVRRPMFPSITRTTRSFTFESPKGLLFDTRFAQVALVLFELSAFRDAQHRGLIVDDAPFAGHSLGEYAALASVGGMMRLRDLVDVVFFRGLTMQNAVPRDSQGRSSYGMVAVAAAKAFAKGGPVAPDAALASIVDLVGRRSGELLQTVNFNVAEQQSVVAGHEVALWAMGSVLDRVGKRVGPNVESYAESADVIALVEDAVSEAKRLAAHGSVPLERGLATIPLAGIDVPFHSRFLESGIPPFRAFLQQRLRSEMVHPDKLVGRYIPNLTASPFALSREYVERIHDQTGSAVLERVLADWDSISAPGGAQELAATIVVELLTYQFASPVRWIETQDIFFRDVNFARLVEFGPGPILVGMANRTLAGRYLRSDRTLGVERKMLCSSKDHDAIGYVHSAPAAAADDEGPAKASSPAPAPTPAPAPAAPVVAAAPAAPVEAVEVADAPLDPVVTLKAILAQKMKLASSEVASSKTIKSMTGGRSTLQNEIIGDLQLEFSELPDRSEDLSIEDLGKALQPGYSGTLGKYTTALVARLVTSKMPGGFGLSAIKAQANKNWGLGPGRTDALLLEAITREPAQRLPNEAEATKWLQTVAEAYAAASGISLTRASAGGAGQSGGAAGGAVVSSQELLLLQAKQEAHAQKQIQALQDYLGVDVDLSKRAQEGVQEHLERVTRMFDDILAEHGDSYTNGIQGKFEPLHARHYESYWNWSRQNVALLFADLLSGKIDDSDAELATRCIALVNQLDGPAPLEHERRRLEAASGPGKALALRVCELLLACRFDGPSRYQDARAPLGPSTSLDARGNTVYKEVPRAGLASLEDYVLQMASSGRYRSTAAAPRTLELVQQKTVSTDSTAERSAISFSTADGQAPWLRAARKERASWLFDEELTQLYLDGLLDLAKHGRSYHGLNVLVTGAGKGSIAAEMVKRLLSGGARVIVTTSSFSPKKAQEFQKLYREWGGRGSRLTVVPFNQASRKDVSAVVEYVYSTLKVDIDVLVPFAAISENGRQIDGIDDQSELAHRIMLTNVVRLMGAIKTHKSARRLHNRPTQVILPLSFNHGVIGNDGLYGASKIGLETLLNSVRSEDWSDYLFVTGANIGICRGTDLMADLDVVAEGLERDLGLRTFSTHEMAFNLMGLLDPDFAAANQIEPVMLDLTGDASQVKNISYHMRSKTAAAQQASEIRRSVIAESSNEFAVTKGHAAADLHRTAQLQPRGLSKFAYPEVGSHELNQAIARSEGPLDLDQVIVVTGFAEVGPWGSSRTRWEMEVDGAFSVEGLIEMAWLTGKIRHFDGKLASGKVYVGWVDAKTGEPVHDSEVRARYEKQILEHAGIRLVEPELLRGFDPDRKGYTQEVQLNHDLEALEVSASEAAKYRLQHGDNVAIWEDPATGSWYMRLKKGASILLPKAVRFDRRVAGQLPTGWSAARYGIPDDIVAQTDETALYALVCVAEALVEAGIDDPYELFKHVHVSEVGTCLGSAMGGLNSLSKMFRDRRNDVEVQNDILQETFINTVAGWINLLLVSSCGPITPTVGACATALQSLDVAAETIRSGKAKIMVAGGYEGLSEESMFEFAQMKATASSDDAFQAGLGASEMSKPMTSGRSGFVESMGCGVQIVMSAATALAIGAPINGILAFSRTASDRQGRSIPAPGQGVLSTAAPLKRALASWGLGGDDVGVISMHGTSTKANDRNESDVYHKLLQRIGRTPGNAVPAMAQKWLCGHAKGGAAALAINGLMQSINSATVAGNRNADDIAAELRRFDYLMYPCTSLARTRTDLHAGLVTSFGFGQVGGAVLVLHGSHLLGRLSRDDFEAYLSRRERRQAITFRRMQSLLVKGDLVRIKEHAPYPAELESEVLLDPEVRAERIGDSYGFRLPLVTAGGDGRAVEEAA